MTDRTCLRFINIPHSYKHTHSHKQTHTHTHWLIHSLTHTHTHTHTHIHTKTHTHILKHTGTCVKSVNMFSWGIFGAVWESRGGGQELSAEVIRAPGWGSWYPPFWPLLPFFCAPIGAFFRWYPPFPCYTKDFTCRSEVPLNPCISVTNKDFEK